MTPVKILVMLTAFTCGAAVMILELIGTRILAPWFGVSLYVWTAQIAVAMACLAVGYWIGGLISGRNRPGHDDGVTAGGVSRLKLLFVLPAVAGAFTGLVPLIAPWVLPLTDPLGPRWGAMAASALMFGVPFMVLAMVSPVAVHESARTLTAVGLTSGRIYAVSTLGSLLGTVCTGLYLIPSMGIRSVLTGTSATLIALAAAGLFLAGGAKPALIAICAGAACLTSQLLPTRRTEQKPGILIRHSTHGLYGRIDVVERDIGRWLVLDGTTHSAMVMATGLPGFSYAYFFGMAPLIKPDTRRVLLLGLGGASIATIYDRLGIAVDAVEIDPMVVSTARRFFHLPERTRVHAADARTFLRASEPGLYDAVIFDTYAGDTIPLHLTTCEAYQSAKRVLTPGGLVMMNFVGSTDERAWPVLLRTLQSVFTHVRVFTTSKDPEKTNILVICRDSAIPLPTKIEPDGFIDPLGPGAVMRILANELPVRPPSTGPILTDDFSPLDAWSAPAAERRRALMRTFFTPPVI